MVTDVQQAPATTRQRRRALNQAARECGRVSYAAALDRYCPRCGAGPGEWCQRFGKARYGHICAVRLNMH